MSFGPGSVIAGRYHADRLVGTGGMGEVWLGENATSGTKVALKRLLPTAAKHPEVVTRFRREAMLLGRIQSDHVARVFDFVDDPAFGPVLVMEFIEGPSLAQILEDRSLSIEEAVDLAADLAAALNDLHEAKVVHRDLKPGNVIMRPQNENRPRAVIVDFGIGRQLAAKGSPEELTGITRANIALGTVEYMAPEQILNSRDVTPQSDIYAVGAMLFRSVAGMHAFGVRRGEELARAKLIEDAPRLDTGRADEIAHGFADIVARALKKRPSNRFQSADELLAAVRVLEDRMRESVESTTAQTRLMPIQRDSAPGEAPRPRTARTGTLPPSMAEPRASLPGGRFADARPSHPEIHTAPPSMRSAPGSRPDGRASLPSIPDMGAPPSRPHDGMPRHDARVSVPAVQHNGRASLPSIPESYGGRPHLPSIPESFPGSMMPPVSAAGHAPGRHFGEPTEDEPRGVGKKTVALAVLTAFAAGSALGVGLSPFLAPPPLEAAPMAATASAAPPSSAAVGVTREPDRAQPCPAPAVSASGLAASAVSALPSVPSARPPVLKGRLPDGGWTPPAGGDRPSSSTPHPIDTQLPTQDTPRTPTPVDSTL